MAAPMSPLPRFFKVIYDQELKEETRIPKAIATKYWKRLPNPIFLRLNNGDEWEIFWEKRDNGDVWLHKNWKDFARSNSLRFGYFLVLDHDGESRFEVSIFDSNCVEIDYSSRRDEEEVEESDDDDSDVQIVEEDREILKPLPLKKVKTSSNGKPKSSAPSEKTNNHGKSKINVAVDDATQKGLSGANRGGMVKDRKCSKAEAINEISRNFPSNNPFCVIIMTPYYVQQNVLVIPCDFSRKHLYGLEGTATFGVGKDLKWKVSFNFEYARERTRLCSGWKSFALDNNLQVGDVCIFEMIQRDPVTFKVHVNLSSEQLQGYTHEANKNKRKREAEENMKSFGNSRSCPKTHELGNSGTPNSEADKFVITVKSYYPNIPTEFMKRHSRCHGNFLKLKVEERWWDVKVLSYEKHTRLCEGWGAFKRGCRLNNGDICLFEMIDEEKLELKVSITRKHH